MASNKLKPSEVKNLTKFLANFVKSYTRDDLKPKLKFRDYILPFPFITNDRSYPGAYVKNPLSSVDVSLSSENDENEEIEENKKGIIEQGIIDLDAASLYPTIIYSLNASPETLVYLIPEQIAAVYLSYKQYMTEDDKKNFKNFVKFFLENKKGKEFIKFLNEYLKQNESKIKVFDANKEKIVEYTTLKDFISFLYEEVEFKNRPLALTGAVFYNIKEKEGVLRQLIKIPVKKRQEIKKLIENAPDPKAFEDKNKLYKLLANSLSGFLGYNKSRIFSVILATTITLQGRFFIKFVSYKFNEFIEYLRKPKVDIKLKYEDSIS